MSGRGILGAAAPESGSTGVCGIQVTLIRYPADRHSSRGAGGAHATSSCNAWPAPPFGGAVVGGGALDRARLTDHRSAARKGPHPRLASPIGTAGGRPAQAATPSWDRGPAQTGSGPRGTWPFGRCMTDRGSRSGARARRAGRAPASHIALPSKGSREDRHPRRRPIATKRCHQRAQMPTGSYSHKSSLPGPFDGVPQSRTDSATSRPSRMM